MKLRLKRFRWIYCYKS